MTEKAALASLYSMYSLGLISHADFRSQVISSLSEPIEDRLLKIAICDENDTTCIAKEAKAAFERSPFTAPDTVEVLRLYASYISNQILDGAISPREGADLISKATVRYVVPDFHELDAFKYASSELPDRPEDSELFERAILREAAVWNKRTFP